MLVCQGKIDRPNVLFLTGYGVALKLIMFISLRILHLLWLYGMQKVSKIFSFTLGELRLALYLSAVERVYRLAEITPLPKAPEIVLGLINLRGRIVPVVNVRRRFRIPDREAELSDKLILARTSRRPVALVVDDIGGVLEIRSQEIIDARTILPAAEFIAGVVKLADGMIFIHDLDTFLSLEEEALLDEALAAPVGPGP